MWTIFAKDKHLCYPVLSYQQFIIRFYFLELLLMMKIIVDESINEMRWSVIIWIWKYDMRKIICAHSRG